MANNLKTLRARIADLTAEIKAVDESIPPASELENRLRVHLQEEADAVDDLVGSLAAFLMTAKTDHLYVDPARLARKSFGLAVSSIGIGHLVQSAVERAKAQEDGRLRLSTSEKRARLAELKRERYLAELDEQEIIGTAEQRPDVSGAAVLLIPVGVVEDAGIL